MGKLVSMFRNHENKVQTEFRLTGRAGMTKGVTFQKEWKAVTFRRCTNMHL
jgi:hypothetical protein